MSTGLRFRLLGTFEVTRDGEPLRIPRGRLRVLLAAFALEANRTVPFERLIDRLWGEQAPPAARKTVHVYAMRLRKVLGDGSCLRTDTNGYALVVEPERVDVSTFDALLERAGEAGARGDVAAESKLLGEALALWRGPALHDVASDSLHQTVVPRLTEKRLRAVERRLEIGLDLGRHAELVAELTGLTQEHPTREGLWLLLMRALSRSGRQAEALAAYRTLDGYLRDELGIEPGEAIRRVHQEILAGERADVPSAPVAPAPVAPAPCQLPPGSGAFVGRDDYVDEVTAALLDASGPAVILSGPPGVGKTALAVHVARRLRDRFPDGQLYADLRGYAVEEPLSPVVVLAQFLRALGVPDSQVPLDRDDQVSLYRSLLADRRVVIVLDNAAGPEQVRPLLPGHAGCAALVTSRDDLRGLVALDGVHHVGLPPFDQAEARAVLAAVLDGTRLDAEPEAVADLAEKCGRLPLALRIAATNLRADPHASIAGHVAALRRRGLDQLQVRGDARAAVRATFDLSYARLAQPSARMFHLLSAVPGPDFAVPAAVALTGSDRFDAEQALDELVAANLLVSSAAGRYQFHDLLREYAASRAAEDGDLPDADARMWDFYLHTARAAAELLYADVPRLRPGTPAAGAAPLEFASADAAVNWLDAERPTLLAAASTAAERGRPEYAWLLADALRGYFHGRGHAVEGLAVCDAALAAARAEGDRRAEAAVLDVQGLIHFALSRYPEAERRHQRALEIGRESGDLEGQAGSLYHLGRISAQVAPPEQAGRYHRAALDLARQTGDVHGQVLNTNYIGVAHLNAGRIDESLRWHLRAVDLGHEAGVRSMHGPVIGNLANVAWYRGELRIAIELYRECLEHARRHGDRKLGANSLICLAEARCDAGEYDRAISDAEAAIVLGRYTGERRHEVGGAEVAATARLRAGRADGVIGEYERALGQAREIGFRYGEASILAALAAAHRAAGEPAIAADHAGEAVRVTVESGRPAIRARALVELGHALLDLGDPRGAESELDDALALARRAGLRLAEARALYVRGLAAAAGGGQRAARGSWQAALDIFTEVGAPEAESVRALLT